MPRSLLLLTLALCTALPAQTPEPSWEVLNARPTPTWFAEAKFGIFVHWGVYAVPSFSDTSTYSEWYQWWVKTGAHDGLERRFHEQKYGADFEYREFAPMLVLDELQLKDNHENTSCRVQTQMDRESVSDTLLSVHLNQ